jgi:hypothetical protein
MSRLEIKGAGATSLRNRRLGLALAFLTLSYIAAVIVFLIVR